MKLFFRNIILFFLSVFGLPIVLLILFLILHRPFWMYSIFHEIDNKNQNNFAGIIYEKTNQPLIRYKFQNSGTYYFEFIYRLDVAYEKKLAEGWFYEIPSSCGLKIGKITDKEIVLPFWVRDTGTFYDDLGHQYHQSVLKYGFGQSLDVAKHFCDASVKSYRVNFKRHLNPLESIEILDQGYDQTTIMINPLQNTVKIQVRMTGMSD